MPRKTIDDNLKGKAEERAWLEALDESLAEQRKRVINCRHEIIQRGELYNKNLHECGYCGCDTGHPRSFSKPYVTGGNGVLFALICNHGDKFDKKCKYYREHRRDQGLNHGDSYRGSFNGGFPGNTAQIMRGEN